MLISVIVIVAILYLLKDSIQNSVIANKQKDELAGSITAAQKEMAEIKKAQFGALTSYDGTTFDNGKGSVSVSAYGPGRYVVVVKDGVEIIDIRSEK